MSFARTMPDPRVAAAESTKVRRANALERHILRLLASSPPISDERRAQLAALLAPCATYADEAPDPPP